MDDLISRQAVIDAVTKYCIKNDLRELLADIECLPTAEKKGEWIPFVDGNYIVWECSECHVESDAWTDYCPICGSRNIEEMDEEAFEKALEEFRKNPKTYTLDEIEAELGLTAKLYDKAAFEAGYTKAQMELKDAYKPKKGKWKMVYLDDGDTELECDVCGELAEMWYMPKYCPKCGARMEE